MKRTTSIALALCVAALAVILGSCDNPLQRLAEKAQALAASPVISVGLPDGTAFSAGGTYNVGSLTYGNTKDITITIANTGKNDLVIGDNAITLTPYTGTAAGLFTITSRPSGVIAPGGSGTLGLHFIASSPGTKAVSLSIASNDVGTATWTLRVAVQVSSSFSDIQSIGRLAGEEHATSGLGITFTSAIEATSYGIYRATSLTDLQAALTLNSTPLVTVAAPTDGSTTITAADTTAIPGTMYYYSVRTYSAGGHADGNTLSASVTAPILTGTATTVADTSTLGYVAGACGTVKGMAVDATTIYLDETWTTYNTTTYVTTSTTYRLRTVPKAGGTSAVLPLTGYTYAFTVSEPGAICALGSFLYVVANNASGKFSVNKVNKATGAWVATVVSESQTSGNGLDICTDGVYLYMPELNTVSGTISVYRFDPGTGALATLCTDTAHTYLASSSYVTLTAVRESSGDTSLYILDRTDGANRIVKLTGAVSGTPALSTFLDSPFTNTTLNGNGIASDGTYLYAGDLARIARIKISDKSVSSTWAATTVNYVVGVRSDGASVFAASYDWPYSTNSVAAVTRAD